jgi:CheY-like chemotaxis protein
MLSRIFETEENVEKILVVDDEPDTVMLLSKFLRYNGYEVITAGDGFECITRAKNEQPDLILLDNIMPNMDGQTTLGKLRASKETKDIHVIMITALSDEKYIASAQQKGAVEYLMKPFNYVVLLEKIDQALKSKGKRRATVRE